MDESLHQRRERLRYEIQLLERQSRDINRLRAHRELLNLAKNEKYMERRFGWSKNKSSTHHQDVLIQNGWSWDGVCKDENVFVIFSFRINKLENRGWEWGITAWDRAIEEEIQDDEIFFIKDRDPIISIWEKNPSHRLPWFGWKRKRRKSIENICQRVTKEILR